MWSQTRAVLPLTARLMGQDTVSWAERNIKMSSMILPAFLMVFDHCEELPLFYNGTIESSLVSKDLLSPLPGLNSPVGAPRKSNLLIINNSRKLKKQSKPQR